MTTFNVYRREQGDNNPPAAIATGLTSKSYSDLTAEKGHTYLYSIGAEHNGIEKISDEVELLAGTPWTPENLTNAVKLWVSSDSVVVDGSNRISQLTDKSGNSYHFTQSNNNYKPILANVDGNTVIRFDGSNDYVNSTLGLSLTANTNKIWSFAVFKLNAVPSSATGVVFSAKRGDSNESNRFSSTITVAGRSVDYFGRADTGSGGSHHYPYIFTSGDYVMTYVALDHSVAQSIISVNGLEANTIATGLGTGVTSNSTSTYHIIGAGRPDREYLDFDLIDLMVSSGSLPTSNELDRLFGWAAHKYGLTDNLPINHPYKTLVPTL